MFRRIKESAGADIAAKVQAEVEALGPMTEWELAQKVAAYARQVMLKDTN